MRDDVDLVELMDPPAVPRRSGGAGIRLIPVAMAVVSLGVGVLLLISRPTSAPAPALVVFPLMMLLSAGAALASGGQRGWRAELDADRRRYLDYLETVAGELSEAAVALRDRLLERHPVPGELWVVEDDRLWGCDRGASDFGEVRVGVGPVPAPTRAVAPAPGPGEPDPVTWTALTRLVRACESVPDAPVTVALSGPPARTITVTGSEECARALVRAMLCQLAVTHDPADLTLAATCAANTGRHWEWLKWLPHQLDRPGAHRRVVVADGVAVVAADPVTTVVQIVAGGGDLRVDAGAGPIPLDRPDQLSAAAALAVARRLAGRRCRRAPTDITPNIVWDSDADGLAPVPIGAGDDGGRLELDIRETAAGGIGPHGLCLGATGSGKSELLRAIALGMIARHSPATLNLILIDFKGGATFLDLAGAPHTAAVVTNLGNEAHLVDRMREALSGEIDRRQRLLREAGNFSGVAEYLRARRAGAALNPLPALFVIVDEFSEMLSRHPEFADVFVAIGRLGRSLGIHLLLASQRLDEGRLRGLDSHLSYRICLKTLSDSESRIAIGVPDAYHLPARPGAAYLKAGSAEPVPFQTAFVSGPAPVRREAGPPRLFRGPDVPPEDPAPGCGTTVLQTVVDAAIAAADGGPVPHPVWLVPLTESPALSGVLAAHSGADLQVPIGMVDRIFEHRREPLVLELSTAAGHIAIVGGPRSGKTTAVRTLVTALAATHLPRRAQVYCLDFGGGGLAGLAELPHVGVVAAGTDADLVRRTVADVLSVLRRREAGADLAGSVFLLVDGWGSVRREYEDLEAAFAVIAGSGLSHRVHLILTAARWSDIRPGLRDQIGSRVELRLGDPAESEIDRARAARVPRDSPGHGLSADGLPMVVALPGSQFREEPDGWRAPPVRLLPALVGYRELRAGACTNGVLLGIGEQHLAPLTVDLTQQHLLVFGDRGCGKTAVLRVLCHEIRRTQPGAQLVVCDPRRSLEDTGGTALHAVEPLLEQLRTRLADGKPSTTTIYVVIDDYELAAATVAPLAELLPRARDIGLHVVVARSSGGAARALYDPVLSVLRESGPMVLQLSASPDDGPLIGAVRPRPMPPGRGVLGVRAGDECTVQVAWVDPG